MEGAIVVGIAGLSGSGKTTLAARLRAELEGAVIFSMDAYYKPLRHLPVAERAHTNFDHPDALDWELLLDDLSSIAAGHPVDAPRYDFALHDRTGETVRLGPARHVIVEGLLALWHEELRRMLHLRVFVETPVAECHLRRAERDTAERGRTLESVERQWRETVHPMAVRFIVPTRSLADVVVRGDAPVEHSAAEVLARLHARAARA